MNLNDLVSLLRHTFWTYLALTLSNYVINAIELFSVKSHLRQPRRTVKLTYWTNLGFTEQLCRECQRIFWGSLVVLSSDQGLCSSDRHISCLTWPKACQWQPCPRNLWKLKKSCFEGCSTAFKIDSWICFRFQFIASCSESILFCAC